MKISLIIPSFYPAVIYGGPIFSTLHTCEELAKLDDIDIYVSATNANMTTKLDVETNKWNQFDDHFFVKYYNTTIKHTLSLPMFVLMWHDIKKADIVHIQSIYNLSTPFALGYAIFFKKPVLLSPRGQFGGWCLANGSRFKQRWLNWLIAPFAYAVVWHATADQERDEILAIFPDVKVAIIPNGIAYDIFQNVTILSPDQLSKKYANTTVTIDKVIISMGRLQKKKGFDVLIDAFVKVLEKFPKAKLFIAGQDEGEKENLMRQIEVLGIAGKVFLTGPINGQDKIDFLANADLFVLPSHNENFGNVYIESLAAGTPIVASKNTPWSEVDEADCGRWVNNSVEETANAIIEMLVKDREQMRINAKKLAKKYDWKSIALQFREMFERMINERI